MRTDKEWMREDTWHFEVEVLRIYGRQELWSHGFGARPVSDGPYQPVDAADVRRRVAFGARQDNEFAVRHCCVHRSRWSACCTASSASALEVAGSLRSIGRKVDYICHKLFFSSPRRPLAAPAPSLPLPAGGLPRGGSSYGSRGRPPDTTGRAVPLTGFPRGFLEEGSRPRIAAAHRPAVGPTSTRTMDQQRLQAQLYPHLP
ncbi:hypothetical protein THAOC_29321, partial [Thalassiosira oceanica]